MRYRRAKRSKKEVIRERSISPSVESLPLRRLEPVGDPKLKDKVLDVVPLSELEEEEKAFLKSYRPRPPRKRKGRPFGRLLPFLISLFLGLLGGLALGALVLSGTGSESIQSLKEMISLVPQMDHVELTLLQAASEGGSSLKSKHINIKDGGSISLRFGKDELRYSRIQLKRSLGKALNNLLYPPAVLNVEGIGAIKPGEDIMVRLAPERSTTYRLTALIKGIEKPIGSFSLSLEMNAEQWLKRAEALKGEVETQDYCYRQALKLKPDNVNIALLYADFLMETHKWAKAAEQYRRVISLDPKNVHAKKNLASLYYQKTPRKALKIYKELVIEDPSNKITYYKRIAKLQERLNIDPADTYRAILSLNPKDKDAQRDLGTLYARYIREARRLEKQGKLAAAIRKVRDARKIEVNKQNTQYLALLLNNIGYYYAKKGKNKKAVAYYLESIKTQSDPLTYLNMADAYVKLKDQTRALQALKRAEELKPDKKLRSSILTLWVSILIERKETKKAIKRLNQLLELTPKDPNVHEALGKAYLDIKDYEKALVMFKKAAKYQKEKGKKAIIYKLIGDLYRREGSIKTDIDEKIDLYRLALNAYEKAFTLKKGFKEARERWNQVAELRKTLQIKKMISR